MIDDSSMRSEQTTYAAGLLNDPETIEMMATFIETNPHLWNEDIGEPSSA